MLTTITSEVATSTGDQVSSTASPPSVSLSTDPPSSAVELSLKTPETEVLDQAEMYTLDNSLGNTHLLQVSTAVCRVGSSRQIYIVLYPVLPQVSVTMSETEPTGQSAVVATITDLPADSDVTAGGQMWSGGGEDKPEQLMAPDVQEEVSLLDEQSQ